MTKTTLKAKNKKIILLVSSIFLIILALSFLNFLSNIDSKKIKNNSKGHKNYQYKKYTTASKSNINNNTVNPTVKYYCHDKSMQLNGNKCSYISSYDATVTYSCTSGVVNYSSGNCEITTVDSEYNVHTEYTPANKQYICGGDYSVSGTKCIKTYTVDAIKQLTCPSNYNLINNKCILK